MAAGQLRRAHPPLPHPTPAANPPANVEDQEPAAGEPSKRERTRRPYAALLAAGQPVTGVRLAEAAGVSASYGRALLAEFQADATLAGQGNGQRSGPEVGSGDRTSWRTCPSCGSSFEQPDDPGRKRVYCSRACQQADDRARQRFSAGQRDSAGQHTGRQDWRSGHQEQRRQRPGSGRPGAGQRHNQRHERQDQQHQQRRPPPGSANGHRPGAASGDELAGIRCVIAGLLRKAAATSFPHEAAACREKGRPCGPSTASSR